MAQWPPYQIANVFVFEDGSVGPLASYGYVSTAHPSTGVYEVTFAFSKEGADQYRTSTFVNLRGAPVSDLRVSNIVFMTNNPVTIQYNIRNGAGALVDWRHVVKVTQT